MKINSRSLTQNPVSMYFRLMSKNNLLRILSALEEVRIPEAPVFFYFYYLQDANSDWYGKRYILCYSYLIPDSDDVTNAVACYTER